MSSEQFTSFWERFELRVRKLYYQVTVVEGASCGAEHVEDRDGVVVLHQRKLVQLHQGQREPEEGFVSLQEEEIPESDNCTDRQTVYKYRHEPVE